MISLLLAFHLVAAPPATSSASPPAKASAPRIVVLDVSSDEKTLRRSTLSALSDLVTLELSRYGNGGKAFDVLSGRELRDAMKLEGDRAMIGCDQASCAGELAQAYGARYVVFLVLTRLGSTWTLNLSLYDSDGARVVGRSAAQANDVASLTPSIPTAVRTLAATLVPVDAVPVPRAPTSSLGGASTSSSAQLGAGVQFPEIGRGEIALKDEPHTALDASGCAYDDAADRWSCGTDKPVVELRASGSASTAGDARFVVEESQPGCVAAVDVELQSAEQSIAVDWRDAIFIVNGVAVPAHPQTPIDRAVTAPAGVVARTKLVPNGQACVASVDFNGTQDVVATVPYFAGKTPARATFLRTRRYAAVDERDLLRAVPMPAVPAPPADLVEANESHWPMYTLGAAGVVVGVGALAGVCTGTFWMPKSSTLAQRADVGAGWGAVCAGCTLIPAGVAGVIGDTADGIVLERKKQETAAYRRAQKSLAAWRRINDAGSPPSAHRT